MASRGVNKVIIIGNLGQDPDMRYMTNGNAVANVSVATSEAWKDKATGQPQEKTEWHRIVFFRKLAEIVGQYLKKGSKVYIEGKLQTRKWQDKTGQDRYITEIIANEMQMLGDKPGNMDISANTGGNYGQQQGRQQRAPGSFANQGNQQSAQNDNVPYDDDIPF